MIKRIFGVIVDTVRQSGELMGGVMKKERSGPRYERRKQSDPQKVVFCVGMVGGAILCMVVFACVLGHLGIVHLPTWVR